MKRRTVFYGCAICSLFFLASAGAAERDSVRMDNLPAFEAVSVSAGIETIVSPEVECVTTVAVPDVLPMLEVGVEEGVLKIGFKRKGNSFKALIRERTTVYVPQKSYRLFSVASASVLRLPAAYRVDDLRIEAASGGEVQGGLECSVLTLRSRSGSVVRLHGGCDSLSVDAASGAVVRCEGLKAGSAVCEAASGTIVRLYASRQIDISAASGAIVTYDGDGEARIDRRSGAIVKRKK